MQCPILDSVVEFKGGIKESEIGRLQNLQM